MMIRKAGLAAICCVLLLAGTCFAWDGKVVGIADGDTITVMHDGRGERLRIWGVDSPEKKQDFGMAAKKFTSSMVYGKTVSVEPVDTDRYGRTVAIVRVDGKCLNEELVRAGMAWVYKSYCKSGPCGSWLELEKNARSSGIGLWSMKDPVAPWEFRRHQRSSN